MTIAATRNGRRETVVPIRMLEPFDALSGEEADALDQVLPIVRWREGSPPPPDVARLNQLLIVRGGILVTLARTSTGGEVGVNVLSPGAVVSSLGGSEAPVIEPLEDSWLTPVRAPLLRRLLAGAPGVGMCLLSALAAQLEESARIAATFSELRVEDRLMATFLRIAARRGVVTADGVEVGLRLTHADWARLVGASREAVTASLIRMRRRGELRCEGRRVVLPLETAMSALEGQLD